VKKAVDKAVEESHVSCVLVSTIRKELKKDPRTVRQYLNILAEAEYGKFSTDGKLFCPKKTEPKTS
jgi:Mn-dependent DtxR family transcriptional regulator